jgi:hypothetical protein
VSLSYALRDQIEFSILFKNDFETKKQKGFIDRSLSPNAPHAFFFDLLVA